MIVTLMIKVGQFNQDLEGYSRGRIKFDMLKR